MSIQRIAAVSVVVMLGGSPAMAASVQLGVDDSLVTINSRVAEARYRLDQTNWDQMVSNGAEPITAADIRTANLGTATALNGFSWDFSLAFESGDSGTQGFTWTLAPTGGGSSSTLVYDVASPLNGQTPTGFFDGIKIEARAGVLRDVVSTATLTVTGLSFTSSLPASGSLPSPITVFTPPVTSESFTTWITSDMDLGAVDWLLTGTVVGSFDCNGIYDGGAGCLRQESVKINFKMADVTVQVVPVPAAAWLLGSALVPFGLIRRRLARG